MAMKHVPTTGGTLAEPEVKFPILFEGAELPSALKIDMLVEKCVIAEMKSVAKMPPVFEAQFIP
jgi:GxxExxY protein